jgi:hypothetical protein
MPLPEQFGVEFRFIPDWHGYASSSLGDIWSCRKRTWRKLRPGKAKRTGHLFVSLYSDCEKRNITRYVHQLVLFAFQGPRPAGYVCRHFPDRNPANNRPENLQWGTVEENGHDKIIHGTTVCLHPFQPGKANLTAKLTNAQAAEIRWRYLAGGVTQLALAIEYGVTQLAVSRIVRNIGYAEESTHELSTPRELTETQLSVLARLRRKRDVRLHVIADQAEDHWRRGEVYHADTAKGLRRDFTRCNLQAAL